MVGVGGRDAEHVPREHILLPSAGLWEGRVGDIRHLSWQQPWASRSSSLPLMDCCLVPDSAVTHRLGGGFGTYWDEGCLAAAAARESLKLISSAGLWSLARRVCVEKFP